MELSGLLWLLLLLGPLFFVTRGLQREIQAIFLMLTRRQDVAIVLFALLFFPGVLLHESSHYIMARLLGVRTGRFSLLPRPISNGRLQLGFVETASVDWLRDALVGAAPLLTGGAFVAFAGLSRLGAAVIWEQAQAGGISGAMQAVPGLLDQPDFWLWFYLTFAISSTMLPSSSDRRAWLPISITAALLVGLSWLAGAGPWLLANAAPALNRGLGALAAVFGITVAIHLVLLAPLYLLRKGLSRLTGLELVQPTAGR